jgi:hypothetical protein
MRSGDLFGQHTPSAALLNLPVLLSPSNCTIVQRVCQVNHFRRDPSPWRSAVVYLPCGAAMVRLVRAEGSDQGLFAGTKQNRGEVNSRTRP